MENPTLDALNKKFAKDIKKVNINDVARVSSQLVEGYEGKIEAFGFIETTLSIPAGEEQKIMLGDTEVVISSTEADPKFRLALAYTMEDGSNIYPSQLRRSAKSTVNGTQARQLSTADFADLEGKTLVVNAVAKDPSLDREITEGVGANATTRTQSYKQYAVTIK